MNLLWVVEIGATIAGIVGAVFWFAAAMMGPKKLKGPAPPAVGGDGDLMFQFSADEYFHYRISLTGRLNALAAAFTGVTALFQLWAFWLQASH